MKIIYAILVIILFLLLGNWYYAEHMPISEKITDTEMQNTEEVNVISAVDPKSSISFNYPRELSVSHVSTAEWPPTFVSGTGSYNCDIATTTAAMSGFTSHQETFNGSNYCLWQRSEGAAGSTYIEYQATFNPQKSDTYVTMNFTLRYVRCENYPEKESVICQNEQDNFNPLSLIDEIAQSVNLQQQTKF